MFLPMEIFTNFEVNWQLSKCIEIEFSFRVSEFGAKGTGGAGGGMEGGWKWFLEGLEGLGLEIYFFDGR